MKERPNGKQGKRAASYSGQVVMMDARELIPSKENLLLYHQRSERDTDYARLLASIRAGKVEAPLLVSVDLYILSGHQRREAAIEAEKFPVPVIIKPIRRSSYTSDEWLALLREHNTGREKSFIEMVRERLVDINPDDAVKQICNDKVARVTPRVETIEFRRERRKISAVKAGMVEAVLDVLRTLKEYLPVSLRAIHYRLLNRLVYRNAKTKVRYVNNLASYHDLSDLVTRLRLTGEIDWDDICDETRPVTTWKCWTNAADFLAEQAEEFGLGYARDLMQSQEQHFEIVAEKLTVQNFINPIAAKYRMPCVIMRGNSGIDARYQMAERFHASGKDNLFLFCLGDCDPDGDSIVESTLRSLRDDFDIDDVDGTRVAMTHVQADGLHLPRMLEAKTKSPNYAAFVDNHGRTDCYELEAVEPVVLQRWLDTAIRGVIDIEAYNHEVAEQASEATQILAQRKTLLEMMGKEKPPLSD
jgi:hypothetical protein